MKKQYYYDYKNSLPNAANGQIQVEPTTPPQKTPPQLSHGQPESSPPPPPPPPSPSPAPRPVPVKKSNFIPIVATTIFLLIVATIINNRLPKNYDQCTKWPGSKTSDSNCKTFYGKSFERTSNLANQNSYGAIPTQPTDDSGTNLGTDTSNKYPDQEPSTKGGQPLTTPTPTPLSGRVPTPQPANPDNSDNDIENWITHRYPDQKLSLKLPRNWHSSNVTRRVDTQIMTFNITSGGTVIDARIQPNWDTTSDAKNNPITFMLGGTRVTKQEDDQTNTYYFEHADKVYIFPCHHHGNSGTQNICNQIIKSITLQ